MSSRLNAMLKKFSRMALRGNREAIAAFVLAVVASATSLTTHAQGSVRLEQIETNPLPGDQVQLRLRLSGAAPQPLSFTINNPARISLDLADTSIALPSRRIDVKRGVIDTVNVAEANGRTRVVLNLNSMAPYETRVEGNTVLVTVGTGVATASASAPQATQNSTSTGGGGRNAAISNVDFRRGTDGSGRVVVQLDSTKITPDLKQEGGRIIVNFPKASIPDNLLRRLDVVDFATPVSNIDALRVSDGARLIVTASGDWEPVAYQTENVYTLEVKPVVKAAAASEEVKEYKGERLTLNFQDIEARAVLQLLADTSGQNIVISDTVQGNVTLRLQNVPWDQALDIVLKTKGLDMRQQGNVILVGPAAEIAAREKEIASAKKELSEVAPLRTEFLQVNYAKAADLAALIKSGQTNSLMSERGSVTIDARTNTLLLQDTADRLADIRRLVSTLDIPIRQVLIEARVVIVNDDFSRDLGVRLGVTGVATNGSDGLYTVSGTGEATDSIVSSAIDNLNSSGSAFPVAVPTGADALSRYMINLPAATPAGSLAVGILGSDYLVDLELSAAQAEGRGEVLSQPKIITTNQKEATIEQGQEIPYQESASSGATTISFKKAVLGLKVTPQITPDDRVILDITVSKDSVGEIVVSSGGINVPAIDTRNMTTTVFVNDGQTVVIGGILETEKRETETKVPWLGDIPVLGHLFKSTSRVNNKDELLIFITPKILREGANIY